MTMSSERKQTVYPLSLSLFFDNFIQEEMKKMNHFQANLCVAKDTMLF